MISHRGKYVGRISLPNGLRGFVCGPGVDLKWPAMVWCLLVILLLVLTCPIALCQDALQTLNGDRQAQANQPQMSQLNDYNLKTGPINLRFQAALKTEFNDNVNYTETNRQADFIFRPAANVRAFWPITEDNSLFFRTGIGYSVYAKNSGLDQLYLNPDSNLSFQMYVGDVALNFHDRVSLIQELTQAPTVSGTGNFMEINNIVGADADWHLSKLILTFGYDHVLAVFPSSGYESSSHNSDFLNVQTAITNDTVAAGLQLGGGLTYYDQNLFSNNTQVNAGPFYKVHLTDYIFLEASVGCAGYFFSSRGGSNNVSNVLGYYANLTLSHQLNAWFNQSLSGGRQLEESVDVDLLDLYYLNYLAKLQLIRNFPISLGLSYQHGIDHGGIGETFDLYGARLLVEHQFTQKLTGSIEYRYWNRNSSLLGHGYFQNQLALQFTYSF